MVKKLNDIKPMPDDGDDDQPELDMSKPLGMQANERTFGKVDLPEAGRQVAKPISLDLISPDPTQPRREVPQTVRNRAREESIPEWLMWHRMAETLLGQAIDLDALLHGQAEAKEGASDDDADKGTGIPLVDRFLNLVSLAASINKDGLTNPITVTVRGKSTTNRFMDVYQIETGERRYQAYRLLYGVFGDERFGKIPAKVENSSSVWKQATENASRAPLNAISKARQLALLIMALNPDKRYQPFEAFDGKCDREFYAQAFEHRIPKGDSERVIRATGLNSYGQIAQHKALLLLPDDLWVKADEEDWKERNLRDHTFTVGKGMATEMKQGLITGSNAPLIYPLDGEGQRFMGYHAHIVQVERVGLGQNGKLRATIWHLDGGKRSYNEEVSVTDLLDLAHGTRATEERYLYRGKEVEMRDSVTWKNKPGMDVLITHLDNDMRVSSQTVSFRDIEELPHPERGQPTGNFPSPATPFVQPKISYDAVGSNMATRLEQGQYRKSPAGKIFQILSILANEVSVVEISPTTGRPMSAAYGMHIATLASYALFDPHAAAREAIMGPDENETTAPAVDNPSSTNADETPELPEWAITGRTIKHLLTGAIATMLGTAWDEHTQQWFVRVQYGPGDWEDLPVVECAPTDQRPDEAPAPTPEPRPRHPGMNPENLMRMINSGQADLGMVWNLATSLGMTEEARTIGYTKVLTPNSIETFLRNDGYEGTVARVESYSEAVSAPLTEMWNRWQVIHADVLELVRQKAEQMGLI